MPRSRPLNGTFQSFKRNIFDARCRENNIVPLIAEERYENVPKVVEQVNLGFDLLRPMAGLLWDKL